MNIKLEKNIFEFDIRSMHVSHARILEKFAFVLYARIRPTPVDS